MRCSHSAHQAARSAESYVGAFERAGDYLGWRAGIRKDGKWLFFVAGD